MLWRKKWPSALSGARLGNLVATGTGLQVRWGNFMSLLSQLWDTSAQIFTSASFLRDMGYLSWKWMLKAQHLSSGCPFPGQTLPVAGEHHLLHICLFGSLLPSTDPCFPTGACPAWIILFPAMQFSPSFVGFPSLLYSVPHCPLARGIWHQNDAVGLALSYLDMMSEVLLIVDISLQLFLTIFLLHSCNVVILVQYTWKLTFMKQRMKGYDFKNSRFVNIFKSETLFCTFFVHFVHCTLFWHFVCFL